MSTIKELVKNSKQAVLELISENIETVSEDRVTDVAFFMGFVKAIVDYDIDLDDEEYGAMVEWVGTLVEDGNVELGERVKKDEGEYDT